MYAGLWRVLPGPVWLRILILLVLAAALVYVLATWVFPWVDDIVTPSQDVTVDQ
jgi:membrane protein implicated in regulation of membrane protease activity